MANSRAARATGVASSADLITLLETLYNSRNPTRRWLHCTRRDWIIAKIGEVARERPGRALEVGFGAGVYLPALAANFRDVFATDLDQIHLEHARALTLAHPNLRVMVDDITASRLPVDHFDFVLCSEVIEHIADTPAVIDGIRGLLAPGGILLLSTPQRFSLMELVCKAAFMPGVISLVRRLYGEAIYETGHINLMTEAAITRALETAGFRIRERFKSGLYLPLVAEFSGVAGMRLERWLEARVREGPLNWSLWTQYYLAEL
ncbi:MAG TPA: class I SAM-dependent methyltransferase [Candidatus Binataceae bacterium]|nr:class I SAM-dependent methyltransferase [Candidatus Binataceae bacterium]